MTTHFQPISGKHAIEACTITVVFPQPVAEETFGAIGNLARGLASANDLPAFRELSLPEGFLNFAPASIIQPVNGLMFQRFARNGTIEAELKCERQSLTLLVREYDRWASHREFVKAVLLPLIPLYTSELSAIHSVRLQYDDRFNRDLAEGLAPTSEMFRPGNSWMTLPDPKTTETWHSHFGLFNSDTHNSRELVNVNVTVVDGNHDGKPSRSVGLVVVVGKFFDIPGEKPLIVDVPTSADVLISLLEECHKGHRSILADVLTDEYLIKIGAKD